jgi:hypothetical protein
MCHLPCCQQINFFWGEDKVINVLFGVSLLSISAQVQAVPFLSIAVASAL